MTYLELAEAVLRNAVTPLGYRDIWERARQMGLDRQLNAQGATPWSTLSERLNTHIRNNGENALFVRTPGYPAQYYLAGQEINGDAPVELVAPETQNNIADYSESDLHPLLAYFAFNNPDFADEREVYTKTIIHAPVGGQLMQWVHPDMVGVYFPFDIMPNAMRLGRMLEANEIFRLYSFELKKKLDRGTYRKYFFQAVSNSSWAHEGYLVAADISTDQELHAELARLSSTFGIGVIHLNIRDISASKVLYPATQRRALSWETINKLCNNNDFNGFISRVAKDFQDGEVTLSEYDKVDDDINAYISEKFGIETVE